ncbi:COesterase and/or Abhydrolase 3 domain containing protein [Asbolus verrucosus]|uniref:COesterase and/or Abhydrolase 3 domain containing protein n=1 Tax=Asbolus verrucosus TaxID=1661398 RepID=A0A482VH58_ASBVE|nr:COesterase and/or Abhydrolase 3 domain containing protein [Asbolus verrucosus]
MFDSATSPPSCFLKTGTKGSAQGNFGLMDLVAGLHWLRENLPAFGGDPERVTLMGHGTGAALVNFIAVSPVAKGNKQILSTTSQRQVPASSVLQISNDF